MGDETHVERKFMASLHRALEDIAPEQLDIFEKWFDPADRRPRFHIAPVIGAVGYLRKSPRLYRAVMTKAGQYAAQWSCREITPLQRRVMQSRLPLGRGRLVRRLLRTGLRSIHRDVRLNIRREAGELVVTVANSVFCRTATPGGNGPICVYYEAFLSRLLDCTADAGRDLIESKCRARGDGLCRFEALLQGATPELEQAHVEATVA